MLLTVLFLLPGASATGMEGGKYSFTPLFTSAEGELALAEKGKNGKKYVLLVRVGSGVFPFLYVVGESQMLHRWKGRNVKLTGSFYWEKDLERPVLKLRKLEPAWRTHF